MFLTLMYHLVDDEITSPMSIPVDSFKSQMIALQEMGVNFLNLKDVERILNGSQTIERGILITFDDGYTNTIEVALPILEEFNIPALMSICGSYINVETRPTHTIHASQNFATVDQIKLWLSSGRDIAGHTYSHHKLTKLSYEEAEYEIALDKKVIETNLNTNIDTFVYPFGSNNSAVREIVGKYYNKAFAVDFGNWPNSNNKLAIRRLEVRPSWTIQEFCNEIEKNMSDSKLFESIFENKILGVRK